MKRKILLTSGVALAILLCWGGYIAWRAHSNLVTLDVRDMDIHEVARKLQWQTWESINLDKSVEGKVTLDVSSMPLESVLDIIGDQISTRWSTVYPLYTKGASLANCKKALRGEVDPATHGWTNLVTRGFGGGGFGGGGFGGRGGFGGGPGGGGPGGDNGGAPLTAVSLQLDNKDLHLATLAFNRYAQTRIVPEDGTTATINARFNQTPLAKAVALVAKQSHRNWTRLYLLQGFGGRGGGRPDFASRRTGTNDTATADRGDRGGRGRGGFDFNPERMEQARKEREATEAELKTTLPPDQLKQMEVAQQERDKLRQEMENLTPEQRREKFQQMGGPGGPGGGAGRMVARIKNTTPEQRLERYRAMAQRGSRGGPGGGRGGWGGR